LTNFNSTDVNVPNFPNFTQNIYQNVPFNENENNLLKQLLNFPQNDEPITSERKDLIVPDFQKEINRLEEGLTNSRETTKKLRRKNQQVKSNLNEELDKSSRYKKELTDTKSLAEQLEKKLAENEIVINGLQAQIDQQKLGKDLIVHSNSVNDLAKKITGLEREGRKLEKKSQQLRDKLKETQNNLVQAKNAYQVLEIEKND
jgi:chromosome segregation ATPase